MVISRVDEARGVVTARELQHAPRFPTCIPIEPELVMLHVFLSYKRPSASLSFQLMDPDDRDETRRQKTGVVWVASGLKNEISS